MKRYLSLDVLRGLTVACMIMVNNPGSWANMYPPLKHYIWDGCSPTDLVFPTFLFVVGASIWFAMRKNNQTLDSHIALKIVKRGFLIFLVGELLKMYPFYNLETFQIRGFGVLQRIAIAYVAGSFLALWLKTYKRIGICILTILAGYAAIVFAFGDATIENYIGRHIDLWVFGEERLPSRLGFKFAPEGLLSTIPAVGTVLIGYLSGKFMGESSQQGKNTLSTILSVAAVGGILLLLGLCLNGVFPINKPIWSSSYVLYAAGIAMQLWAVMSYVIDYREKKGWTTFFNVFGTNALFAFALSGIIVRTIKLPLFMFTIGEKEYSISSYLNKMFSSWTSPELGSWIWSIVMVMVCWGITYLLYRKKIFIKL